MLRVLRWMWSGNQASAGQNLVLSEETLHGNLIRLAIPAVIENVLMTAVYIANTLIIGWLRDETALAAVSVAGVLAWASDAVFMALAISATAIVARSWGAQDRERAQAAGGQAVLLSYLGSILVVAILFPNAEWGMRLMGVAPDVVEAGGRYLRWTVGISLLGFPLSVLSGIMRGAGDTRTPMNITLIMNLLNIIGTYLLVFGVGPLPAYGVVGAGIAAGTSRAIGGTIALLLLLLGGTPIRIPLRAIFRWDPGLVSTLIRVATPASGEYLVQRAGWAIFTRIIALLGTTTLAAHQVAESMESLSFMPGFGLSIATSTLVGQALGARHPHLAERSVAIAARYALLIMSVVGMLFFFANRPLAQLYGATPKVVDLAALALRIGAFEQIGMAIYMVLGGALRGAGDTRSPLQVSLAGIFLLRIPMVYVLAITLGLGLAGVWAGTVIDWTGRATLMAYFYRRGRWKTIDV
ncbi:MAG: MATE family efflux transporter [Anaerolineae bacterium]|nr:MATE family efflux transporter [Anaerolineae bacterium]